MTLYDSTELNENKHHQIYNKTYDEMSIEQTPKGASDSNGLYQYDYADLSAGSSTNGTPQLKIASVSQEEQYAILDPEVTGFDRIFAARNKTRPEMYELAMPTSNISEIAVNVDIPEGHYMVSNEGCYDHANRSICNSEINNVYSHSIDSVYDSAKTDLTNNTN
jgi:hypothetical protein